jgi:pseudouridine synthase
MIQEGRVKVGGKVVCLLGTKADPLKDRIEVDGKPLHASGPKKYILLYKPKNVISSVSDPEGRPVVCDLVKKAVKGRLYPVGRLDYDAEGVLILTNDGEITTKLIHPKYGVKKKYLVKVKGIPSAAALSKIRNGISLDDGLTAPARARFVRSTQQKNSWIEITVTEGRNRLIKRMCMAIGHPVAKLKRVEFAGLNLKGLKGAEFRALTEKEIAWLKTLTDKEDGQTIKKSRKGWAEKTKPKAKPRVSRNKDRGLNATSKPKPRAKPKATSKPKPRAKPKAASKPKPKARPKVGAKPKPKAKPKVGTKAKPKTRPKTKTKTTSRARKKPNSK